MSLLKYFKHVYYETSYILQFLIFNKILQYINILCTVRQCFFKGFYAIGSSKILVIQLHFVKLNCVGVHVI